MLNPRASLPRAAAQLHVWLHQIDDRGDERIDPAHAFRISAVAEAVRIAADAIEADHRSLRRQVCEDMAVLAKRLSVDLAEVDGQPSEIRDDDAGPEALTPPFATVFSEIAEAFVGVGEGLFGTTPVSSVTTIAGPVGHVPRDAMRGWAERVNDACSRIDDTVLSDPEFRAKQLAPAVRDASAARVMLQTAAAGFADCRLLDVVRIERQIRDAKAICVQAESHLTRVDELAPNALRGAIAAMRAFKTMQDVTDEGMALLHSATSASRDPFFTLWRIMSRGKAIFGDDEVASLVEASMRGPLDALASSVANIMSDFASAKSLGRAAYANRAEWTA